MSAVPQLDAGRWTLQVTRILTGLFTGFVIGWLILVARLGIWPMVPFGLAGLLAIAFLCRWGYRLQLVSPGKLGITTVLGQRVVPFRGGWQITERAPRIPNRHRYLLTIDGRHHVLVAAIGTRAEVEMWLGSAAQVSADRSPS